MNAVAQPTSHSARLHDEEVETGGFARVETGAVASRLVVATYNIRYCVGSHLIGGSLLRRAGLSRPKRRPRLVEENVGRAARLLSEGSLMPRADVVAIQEADRGTLRAGGRHVALELARSLSMNFARAHVATPRDAGPKKKKWWLDFEEQIGVGEEGDTGVAILSRLPISAAERIELPWRECVWRPRLALAAVLPLGTRGRLHVFNSHIDTHASVEGQLEQHREVLVRAEALNDKEPCVVVGDFNTMTRESCEAVREFYESRGYASPLADDTATWRSGPIRHHFDWIFTRGLRVLRCGVARTRGISDHWPVWAEVEAAQPDI
jgi:endonuclease/exonuclease/phosphatase family metal-dependent hydrolase